MALTFTAAQNDQIEARNASGIPTAPPFTIACWLRRSTGTNRIAIALHVSGTNSIELATGTGTNTPIRTRVNGVGQALTSTTLATNTWAHACAVHAATNDRRVYLNGGGKGTSGTSVSYGTPVNVIVGSTSLIPAGSWGGEIAEVALWNVALNDNEVAALASGLSPVRLRWNACRGYWPLWGRTLPEPDYSPARNPLTTSLYYPTYTLRNPAPSGFHAPVQAPFHGLWTELTTAFGEKKFGEATLPATAIVSARSLGRARATFGGLATVSARSRGLARTTLAASASLIALAEPLAAVSTAGPLRDVQTTSAGRSIQASRPTRDR